MRITDLFLVLPTFVLALILAPLILEIVGSDAELMGIRATLIVIVVVIGITSWASTARVIRSQALSVKRAGVRRPCPGDRRRAVRHIMRRTSLPNVVNLIIANSVLTFAGAVLTETTLAFIGLGDPSSRRGARSSTTPRWSVHPAWVPGGAWLGRRFASCRSILAFTLVGNALDEILNPRSRGGRGEDRTSAASGAPVLAPASGPASRRRFRECAAAAGGRCRSWPTRRPVARGRGPATHFRLGGAVVHAVDDVSFRWPTGRHWASPASRGVARPRPRSRC